MMSIQAQKHLICNVILKVINLEIEKYKIALKMYPIMESNTNICTCRKKTPVIFIALMIVYKDDII